MTARNGRVAIVQDLRGLAALAVALSHLAGGSPGFHVPLLLQSVTSQGWLGVEVFFVISGFILPYSLWRAGYSLTPANLRRFLWKRVARLDPPYFFTIALVIFLAWLSPKAPGFRGPAFHLDVAQLFAHVGYLNEILGLEWLNPVFWTLAIECQFYLSIAFAFPLLVHPRPEVRLVTAGCMLALGFLLPQHWLVTAYLPLFLFGISAFQLFVGISSRLEVAAVLVPAAGVLWNGLGFPA